MFDFFNSVDWRRSISLILDWTWLARVPAPNFATNSLSWARFFSLALFSCTKENLFGLQYLWRLLLQSSKQHGHFFHFSFISFGYGQRILNYWPSVFWFLRLHLGFLFYHFFFGIQEHFLIVQYST